MGLSQDGGQLAHSGQALALGQRGQQTGDEGIPRPRGVERRHLGPHPLQPLAIEPGDHTSRPAGHQHQSGSIDGGKTGNQILMAA
ncbi:hypothetical protein D3C79_945720 [compost metagenome]